MAQTDNIWASRLSDRIGPVGRFSKSSSANILSLNWSLGPLSLPVTMSVCCLSVVCCLLSKTYRGFNLNAVQPNIVDKVGKARQVTGDKCEIYKCIIFSFLYFLDFLYRCYCPYTWRDSVSPVCGIFSPPVITDCISEALMC